MKTPLCGPLNWSSDKAARTWLLSVFLGFCFIHPSIAAGPTNLVEVKANLAGTTPVLEWHGTVKLPFSAAYAEYTIQRSSDLTHWETVGPPIRGSVGVADEALRKIAPTAGDLSFYRVLATAQPGEVQNDAAGMYGYGDAFSQQLQQLGQLPLDEFAKRYAPPMDYLDAIDFDVTQAQFWPAFDRDLSLTSEEFSTFKTNGFVVSPRLGSYSFGDAYYKIFTNDLPVFVSTDAILHAWHRSFVTMLEEQETLYLAPAIKTMIEAMLAQEQALRPECRGTPLEVGLQDAHFYLSVADSLISDRPVESPWGNVDAILADISALQAKDVVIFGSWYARSDPRFIRTVDFSQFKPRGHYESSLTLQRYFRTLMWLGMIDLRLTPPIPVVFDPDEFNGVEWDFATATALNILLDRAGQRQAWEDINKTIELFVGLGDAMNFSQLNDILTAAQLSPPYTQLQKAYDDIFAGNLGVQNITSGYFKSPFGREQLKLPRAFAFLPQRFTMDSWAFGKTIYDQIIWDEDGVPGEEDKVQRRVPSALDVAFSVFGNNHITPDIVARISNANGHPFRDGKPYQHNLAAVRNVMDLQQDGVWTNSIYASWLGSLRELSKPTTGLQFPQCMRTRAWAMKTVNTQLASWTQLRHDTILYVQQSYTPQSVCIYPKGYVEPRIEFWEAMLQMVNNARAILDGVSMPSPVNFVDASGASQLVDATQVKSNRTSFLDTFSATVARLKSISEKELAGADLSAEEITFLGDLIDRFNTYVPGDRRYTGWYPHLYYRPFQQTDDYGKNEGADFWDALVTDVHTDTPDILTGDPGSVLHEAVGNVHMAFIAVDCADGDIVMFAGPVMSHYEFELDVNTRWGDSEWKTNVRAGSVPHSPPWTRSYLVPGAYQIPAWVPE
jgi:hypothetical protein